MANLNNHAKYLDPVFQRGIAIHADWPMYPEEQGLDLALTGFTSFPPGTVFKRISDIDRCVLFFADVKNSKYSDPFHEKNFHVAVWHEDLLQLQEVGFIEGVTAVSERRWEEIRRSELWDGVWEQMKRSKPGEEIKRSELQGLKLGILLPDDTFKEVKLSEIDHFDEEDVSWPEFSNDGVVVSQAGRDHVNNLLAGATNGFAVLGERVEHLLELSYFDTAVREACISLEHQIKTWLESKYWGDRLVEELISKLRDEGKFTNLEESGLRVFRGQIRSAFKFIRNDFMHNFVGIDDIECRAILFRLVRIKLALNSLSSSG